MSDFKNKTIVLTGATGFIGSHLLKRLLNEDCTLVVITRRSLVTDLNASKLIIINNSLENLTRECFSAKNISKIDIVFHLAGFIPKSSGAANNVHENYTSNLLASRNFLESLPNVPERIIFSSTVDVYDISEEFISESSLINPPTLYGMAKLFCEKLIFEYAKINKTACSILRYGHIYGPGEDAYKKLIPEVIRTLLSGSNPVIYGNEESLRDFLYIDDAVEATIRAAIIEKILVGPVNVVSGNSVSIGRLVNILCDIDGHGVKPEIAKNESVNRSLSFDNCLMKNLLGEWQHVNLFNGLRNEYNFFLEKQRKNER